MLAASVLHSCEQQKHLEKIKKSLSVLFRRTDPFHYGHPGKSPAAHVAAGREDLEVLQRTGNPLSRLEPQDSGTLRGGERWQVEGEPPVSAQGS